MTSTASNTINQINLINAIPVRTIEGYSEPKDSKKLKSHRRRSEECSKTKKKDYLKLYSSGKSILLFILTCIYNIVEGHNNHA